MIAGVHGGAGASGPGRGTMLIRALILTGSLFLVAGALGCRSGTRFGASEAQKSASAASPQVDGAQAEGPLRVRVDPSGARGEDGLVHRTLAGALAAHPGVALHLILVGGTHRGPFTLADGTHLEGEGRAVLEAASEGPAIIAKGDVALTGIVIRGGSHAIESNARLSLDRVALEGQSKGCVHLAGEATLLARSSRFITVAPDPRKTCLVLEEQARAELHEVFFEGPWARALEVSGAASLQAEQLRLRGAVAGLRQRGGVVALKDATIESGSQPGSAGSGGTHAPLRESGKGPAVFVSNGQLTLDGLRTVGHEYGLLTGTDARVRGKNVVSEGAKRAGLGLVRSEVTLEDVRVSGVHGDGAFGGIQSVKSTVELTAVQIHDVRGVGLSQRDGALTLESVRIQDVRGAADGSEGEGLSLRAGRATLNAVSISRTSGAGVVVAETAAVNGNALSVQRAASCGVAIETGGRLAIERLAVRESAGPGVLAEGAVKVELEAYASEKNRDGPLMADCENGAQVRIGELTGQALIAEQGCVLRTQRSAKPPKAMGRDHASTGDARTAP